MTEKATPLSPGFSTADAESVSLSLHKRNGILEFIDWHEQPIKVMLVDTIALKWQEADSCGPEDRDDMSYEIMDSEWLMKHLSQHIIDPEKGYKHYKLCFNATGILEIICREMRVVKVNQ